MIKRVLSHCLLLLICSVSLVYGDCTVGGVKLKLVGELYRSDQPALFDWSSNKMKIISDKYGCRYLLPLSRADSGALEGVSVETDLEVKKQSFQNSYRPGDYYFPITDLYDPVKNTTVDGSSFPARQTQNEYSIRYMMNGELLIEFKGTLLWSEDDYGVLFEPCKGTFKTACGEIWTIRLEKNGYSYPQIKQLSYEANAAKEKWATAARKVGKKNTDEQAKKLSAFRKKAKVGSRVRVFTGNFQAKGLVTEVKKDLVKVQFTEQVIQFQWTNIKPIEQWVQRSNLLPSEGGASLY